MAGEVYDILAQAKLFENVPHGGSVGVDAFHGLGVVLVKVGDEAQELFEAPFFKQPHQTFRRPSLDFEWTRVEKQYRVSEKQFLQPPCYMQPAVATKESCPHIPFIIPVQSFFAYQMPEPQSQWRGLYGFCPPCTQSCPQSL